LKTLNIGVIGAGRIGKLHAGNVAGMKQARLHIVSDLAIHEQAAWLQEVGEPKTTRRYEEVLEDPEVEAVFICSPTDTHVEMIEKAALAGKHIFCEKPVSFDIKETERVLEVVRRAGVVLQTGFNRRFDSNFRKVRELVNSGKLGEPHVIRITSRDPNPPGYEYIRVSGGLLFDMAIHDFDMARYLSGSEVEEVYVKGAVLIDPEIGRLGDIDTAVTTLSFVNGAIGTIDNSRRAAYGYDQRVEVLGSKGMVTVKNDFDHSAEWSTVDGVFSDKPKHFFLERYDQAYKAEALAFVQSVLEGSPVLVDGYDALQAERIACAAKLSLVEGRPVKLAEVESIFMQKG
jgi:myo-inositol 2-dehydrogenase/D-chiro-inositol 1-dehydrogenase